MIINFDLKNILKSKARDFLVSNFDLATKDQLIPQKKDSPYDSPRWGDMKNTTSNFGNDAQELQAYNKLEWVAICIDALMRDVGGRDYVFVNQAGEEIDYTRINPAIIEPIQRGYYNDNFKSLIKRVLGQRTLTGNGYWLKSKSTAFALKYDIADAFIPLPPHAVKPIMSRNKLELYGYTVRLEDGTEFTTPPDQIIHFAQNTLFCPFIGIGNVTKMRLMAEGETEAALYMNEFMQNRATPSMVITSNEDFQRIEDYERKMDLLSSKYQGRANTGKMMYLAGGQDANINVQTLGLSQKDMQFLEQKVHNRQTIISMFECSGTILGIPDGANKAIADVQRLNWFNICNNKLMELENDINQQHINLIDKNVFIKFKKYPTGDIEQINAMIDNAIINPNKASELLGYDSDPKDETREAYYIKSSLYPITMMGNITQEPQEPILDDEDEEDNEDEEDKRLKNLDWNEDKEVDLTDPKNVNAIMGKFFENSLENKRFQGRYFRQALISRNKIEDRFAFNLANFFQKQGERVIKAFNDLYGERKALTDLYETDPKEAIKAIFNLEDETVLMKKEIEALATSGVQRGIMDINVLTKSNVNPSISNPFVKAAITRITKEKFGGKNKDGKTINLNDTAINDLSKIITKGVKESLNINEITNLISNKFQQYEGYRARRIARTESRLAWDNGALVGYQELGVDTVDVVGCTALEPDSDCGKKDVPIMQSFSLVFHPNHIGDFVPSQQI